MATGMTANLFGLMQNKKPVLGGAIYPDSNNTVGKAGPENYRVI